MTEVAYMQDPRRQLRVLSDQASRTATECSGRGDRDGSFYARGARDAYATAAAFIRPAGPGDAELARLVEQVLARDDAREALEFVLASDGPPSCGCGADHWACDGPG